MIDSCAEGISLIPHFKTNAEKLVIIYSFYPGGY